MFHPLGIKDGQFGLPGIGAQAGKQPGGHDPRGPVDDAGRANFMRLIAPFSGFALSGADWAKFLQAHLGHSVNGSRLQSDKLLPKMDTPDPQLLEESGLKFRNGIGWTEIDTSAGRVQFHSGQVGTWSAAAFLLPNAGLGVFAVMNKGGGITDPDLAVPVRIDKLVRELGLSLAGGSHGPATIG